MYVASPLQARSLFLFVTAATPAGAMGCLSTTECTYLPTYLPTWYWVKTSRSEGAIKFVLSMLINPKTQFVYSCLRSLDVFQIIQFAGKLP